VQKAATYIVGKAVLEALSSLLTVVVTSAQWRHCGGGEGATAPDSRVEEEAN